MMSEDEKELDEKRRTGSALGFGSSFAVGMAVFSLGGHWLDGKFGTERVYTLIGIFLGFLYGGWELWKLISESNRSMEVDENNSSAEGNEKSRESVE